MTKQTILQEVNAQMKKLQDRKANDLKTIQDKRTEAQTQKEAAELALKDATERMDIDAYERAKQACSKAQTAIDMYSGRYNQIKQQELISEEESDGVIDKLLAYEKQLEEDFKAAAAEPIEKLAGILKAYQQEVADTEQTIKAWENNIHANYNTRGASSFIDPITGQSTNRSSRPISVHRLPYFGCSEATQLEKYLSKTDILY